MRVQFLFCICFIINIVAAGAQDSTTAPASTRYKEPTLAERVFVGNNYRAIWSQPVRVRIFRLNTEKGGMKVLKLGGGMQTKSLRLEDKRGEKWVLRTVDKTVEKAMEAEGIKSGLVKDVTQEMISASHPYGALTVPPMAKALGVVTADPELVYVPDSPDFGEHSSLFANTMCLLEKLEPVLYPGDQVEGDTEDMLKALKANKNYRLDARMLLQARLLDMLIGDWDRHGGQWKWGYHKEGRNVRVYPIPVDHDQAYFNSSGILVPMVRPFTMKHIVGFTEESTNLKTLNRKEWDFDKNLLGELNEDDWQKGIQRFQKRLTDKVLLAAVQRLPQEFHSSHAQDLLQRLKSRRDSMPKEAMKYFDFLQDHKVKELPPPEPEK